MKLRLCRFPWERASALDSAGPVAGRSPLPQIGVLTLVVWATVATAQPGGRLADRLRQLDRDGDGKISMAEFPGPQFKQMDKDDDGFVTVEEARGWHR